MATPTSAAASAGASLTPSPTIAVAPAAVAELGLGGGPLGADRLDLVRRRPLGQHPVHAERRTDRLGRIRVVARHLHDAAHPGAAQLPQGPRVSGRT